MTLRDEHTNCSLLEEGQRATMSRTGLKRNDNLNQKAWPLQRRVSHLRVLQTTSRTLESKFGPTKTGRFECRFGVPQTIPRALPAGYPAIREFFTLIE